MADDFWERERKYRASIKPMSRAEYLREYPKGGPERYSGARGEAYDRFIAAVKRRDKEARRGSWIGFWWAMVGLALVFVAVCVMQGPPQAVIVVGMLVLCYCFIQMGLNLPSR